MMVDSGKLFQSFNVLSRKCTIPNNKVYNLLHFGRGLSSCHLYEMIDS